MPACLLTCILTYMHTYVRTYIHTYIQTYRHTHIYIYILVGLKALKHWFRIASLPFDTAMSLSDRQNLAESRQFPIFGKPIHSESPQFIWGLPEMEIPQNGWFIMENPTKMDDLVPPFQETSILTYINHTWGVFFSPICGTSGFRPLHPPWYFLWGAWRTWGWAPDAAPTWKWLVSKVAGAGGLGRPDLGGIGSMMMNGMVNGMIIPYYSIFFELEIRV